jgi:hypothetical protein
MVHTALILMNVVITVIIVMVMQPVQITLEPGHVLVTQVILAMVHHVSTSMNVLKTDTTALPMPPVRTTLGPSHALAMQGIQEMELYA